LEAKDFWSLIFEKEARSPPKIAIPANLNCRSVWKSGKLDTRETDPEEFEKITRYRVEWLDH
jgi:hypothetical protein